MLRVEYRGPVLRLTLDRPEVRNAFDDRLVAAIRGEFDGLRPGTRAVVLTGEGGSFCAGGDLNWMRRTAGNTLEENRVDALALAEMLQAVASCPAVVVARVVGPAFGGGVGLVAACDLALAADSAKFAFSEVRLGLVPATIAPHVVRKIGPGHARALFATGEVFGPEHALRIGLVHWAGREEDLDAELDRKLAAVLASAPGAAAAAKQLALLQAEEPIAAAHRLAEARSSPEGKEGVSAFLDKRPPAWKVEL